VAVLDIRVLGDPILRRDTTRVDGITSELRRLVDDLFETMHAAEGIGLAAPQVGRSERLAVCEVQGERLVLFNPEIVQAGGGISRREEGCLSIPDVFAEVARPAIVRVRAQDVDGNVFEVESGGLMAACLQHEIDHLHGRLFLDHLSMLRRRSAMKQWDEVKGDYPDLRRVLKKAELGTRPEDRKGPTAADRGQ
jgi:peptide deformylase